MQPARSDVQALAREVLRGAPPEEAPVLAWPLVCGARMAERARAAAFADGVLTVTVPDASWRAELAAFVAQYLAALNRLLGNGSVRRIDFVIAPGVERPRHRS